MHLLYLDESGSVKDPTQRFYVLAGIAVFERSAHWVEQKLNEVASRFSPDNPHAVELHGSPMRSGREGWKKHPLAERLQAIHDALKEGVTRFHPRSVRLFGTVIDKATLIGEDPVEHAFEQLASRFDRYLQHLYAKHNDAQRGIILFDKSSTEQRIQTLAREFKYAGHTWGKTRNYAEVPVFLDSRASRLIQLADLVAFALFRAYQHRDTAFLAPIQDCFDAEGGQVHGLYLKTR
ncbi:DUF3800 domain-containing protein [uncultured Pigmentiphaga sp.]|jgi:hypothetical protein|uniref:DUF3800 domain-containing protein n=1 Tax=uncultured Pigmentiphaga sp. TaxID=340361 RepID=UPI002610EEC9|nr:DUF3800 domain-containing protein [uncultured Pigmentiphaga sp.]